MDLCLNKLLFVSRFLTCTSCHVLCCRKIKRVNLKKKLLFVYSHTDSLLYWFLVYSNNAVLVAMALLRVWRSGIMVSALFLLLKITLGI
jgi:hypothetical protein